MQTTGVLSGGMTAGAILLEKCCFAVLNEVDDAVALKHLYVALCIESLGTLDQRRFC